MNPAAMAREAFLAPVGRRSDFSKFMQMRALLAHEGSRLRTIEGVDVTLKRFRPQAHRMSDDSPTPSIDPTDPYQRRAQTFPTLTDDMIERIAEFGRRERLPAGSMLFSRGDRGVDFFVVLDGRVEIFDLDEHGEPRL